MKGNLSGTVNAEGVPTAPSHTRIDRPRDVSPSGAVVIPTERTHPRRENFEPTSRLLDHIETVRREHDLPRWVKLPVTEKVAVRKR